MQSKTALRSGLTSNPLYKLTTAAVLVALAVIGSSTFTFPVGAAKCAPVQHLVNVLAGVALGPVWGVSMAVLSSLIRLMLGTGSVLAFPGSIFGALLAGLLYTYSKRIWWAGIGEVLGTGILGAIGAGCLAKWVLGNGTAILFYLPSFAVSTAAGTAIAMALIPVLIRAGLIAKSIRKGASI